MNIDILFPALTGDMTQLGQGAAVDPNQNGQEFEDMLQQQSKASNAQQKADSSAKKSEDKPKLAKTERKSTQEDEATEEGGELAAALVTSQPVVPFELVSLPDVQVTEEDAAVLEALNPDVPVEELLPVTGEEAVAATQQAPVEFVPEQAVEAAPEVLPQQEAPADQAQDVQPQAEAAQDVEVKVVASQAQPQDEAEPEEDAQEENIFQESTPLFHDVKAAPVKVGDVQKPVDVEEPEAPQQIANQVAQAIQQGESMVRIQLNPANLGSVTIELTRDAAGQLTVTMHPETARAYNALTQHMNSLTLMLMDKSENGVVVTVEPPEENQNPNMFDPNGHNGQAKENDEQKKKQKGQTGGVNPTDFLSQLRLGLVDMNGVQ